jgi:hypothetical protein
MKIEYRNAYEADHALPKPKAGEVWVYARLSDRNKGKESRDAGELCTKSVADQNKVARRVAERYQLPLSDLCYLADNLSGKYWWSGVNLGIGSVEGTATDRRGMSALRDRILEGKCKAIVTFSQCRLFRGAAMADAWMDLCAAHGVRVYDSSGLLDIWSPDGKAYVRFLANDNQRQREKSGAEAARGIESSLEEGELCVRASILGFRSEGRRSGRVRPIAEEIVWVKWIFRAYCYGIDDRGPLPVQTIANELRMNPEFQWMPDLVEAQAKRTAATKHNVYPASIRTVLKDVRYRGKQKKNGEIFDCKSFLVGGEPVIDQETFDEAQRRRTTRSRYPNARNRDRYPFSGVLRCHCGQQLAAIYHLAPTKNRPEKIVAYGRYGPSGQFTCKHWVPAVDVKKFDRYYLDVLAPILRAHLSARSSAQCVEALTVERSVLICEIVELERYRAQDLVDYSLTVSPQLASAMESRLMEKADRAQKRIIEIDEVIASDLNTTIQLHDLDAISPSLLSELVRRTVLWAAILPSGSVHQGRKGRRIKDVFVGRILFCLGFGGVFHTAVLEREWGADGSSFEYSLRPADEDECVGTINDLPDPVAFATRVLGNAITISAYYRDWRPSDISLNDWVPGLKADLFLQAKEVLAIKST